MDRAVLGHSRRKPLSLAGTKAYLEPDEVARLEKAAASPRDRLLIRLLSRLGCRISEALDLTIQDINFQQGTATIQHLKTRLKLACPECNAGLGVCVSNVFGLSGVACFSALPSFGRPVTHTGS